MEEGQTDENTSALARQPQVARDEGFAYLQGGTGIVNNMDGETHRPIVSTDAVQGPYLGAIHMDIEPDGRNAVGRASFLQAVAQMHENLIQSRTQAQEAYARFHIEAEQESTQPPAPAHEPGDRVRVMPDIVVVEEEEDVPADSSSTEGSFIWLDSLGRTRRIGNLYQRNPANAVREDPAYRPAAPLGVTPHQSESLLQTGRVPRQVDPADFASLYPSTMSPTEVPSVDRSTLDVNFGFFRIGQLLEERTIRRASLVRDTRSLYAPPAAQSHAVPMPLEPATAVREDPAELLPPIRAGDHISPNEFHDLSGHYGGSYAAPFIRLNPPIRAEDDYYAAIVPMTTPTPFHVPSVCRDTPPPVEPPLCCICLVNAPNCVLKPCRHACMCLTCARALVKNKERHSVPCPLCRLKINKVIGFIF